LSAQVEDYGLSLKLDDCAFVMRCYLRILKVFLLLAPDHEYVRSIVANLLTIAYWAEQRHSALLEDLLHQPLASSMENAVK
jgi:hypothetical protein